MCSECATEVHAASGVPRQERSPQSGGTGGVGAQRRAPVRLARRPRSSLSSMGVARAATAVLLCCALTLAIGALAQADQATPVGERTGALPGAIEAAPVNQKAMEEFWAHVDDHRRRGVAATPSAEAWAMHLVPALTTGMVGWCAVLEGTAQR